jgi:hypothetical protein
LTAIAEPFRGLKVNLERKIILPGVETGWMYARIHGVDLSG